MYLEINDTCVILKMFFKILISHYCCKLENYVLLESKFAPLPNKTLKQIKFLKKFISLELSCSS